MKIPAWWREFRQFDERGLLVARVDGWKAYSKTGYVFDRRIFRTYLAVLAFCILYVVFTAGVGWNEFYLHCPTAEEAGEDYRGTWCRNPFYLDCNRDECQDIVFLEKLPAGFTIGTPPSADFDAQVRGVWGVVISGLFVAFGVNHLVHNRGMKPPTIPREVEI